MVNKCTLNAVKKTLIIRRSALVILKYYLRWCSHLSFPVYPRFTVSKRAPIKCKIIHRYVKSAFAEGTKGVISGYCCA